MRRGLDDPVRTIFDQLVTGVATLVDIDDGWVAVSVDAWATAPITVGEDVADTITAPPIGPGAQIPYRVTNGQIVVRTANEMPVRVKVVWWGEYRPPQIDRPIIGPTAKTHPEQLLIPADGAWHRVQVPSVGQFALTVQAAHANGGLMRVSTHDTYGIELAAGQMLHLPAWNGTLLAKYEPSGRETDGELVTMKHENGWEFRYEVSA